MSSADGDRGSGSSLRARHYAARRRAFLEAARWIVDVEGTDALTMQRLALELDCAVGAIYRYFPSKDDLIAAIRDEQLATLHAALLEGQARFAAATGNRTPDPSGAALVRILVAGRLWVAAAHGLRAELATARQLVARPGRGADGCIVDLLREPFDEAVATGALEPGDNRVRVAVFMAALGDLALAMVTTAAEDLDPVRLGAQLLECLLLAWGADASDLRRADALVAGVRS